MRRRAVFALSLIAPLTIAALARATTIEALDMRALVRESDHVVLATVVDSVARYDHLDRIVTDATLRVDERIWGSSTEGRTLVVRRIGGVLGDVGLRIEGEATFAIGEQVVLFATEHRGEQVLRPVGMSQGVLRVRRIEGADTVMPGGDGLALVQRGSDGQLRPAPGALTQPTPLDALLAEIRDLVAELHDGSR